MAKLSDEKLDEFLVQLTLDKPVELSRSILSAMVRELIESRKVLDDLTRYAADSEENNLDLLPLEDLIGLLTQAVDIDTLITPEIPIEEVSNIIDFDQWRAKRDII